MVERFSVGFLMGVYAQPKWGKRGWFSCVQLKQKVTKHRPHSFHQRLRWHPLYNQTKDRLCGETSLFINSIPSGDTPRQSLMQTLFSKVRNAGWKRRAAGSPGDEEWGTMGNVLHEKERNGCQPFESAECHLKSCRAMQSHIEGTKCPYSRYASIGYR